MQQKVLNNAEMDKDKKINVISNTEECQEAFNEFVHTEPEEEKIKDMEDEANTLSLKNLKKLENSKKTNKVDVLDDGSPCGLNGLE